MTEAWLDRIAQIDANALCAEAIAEHPSDLGKALLGWPSPEDDEQQGGEA